MSSGNVFSRVPVIDVCQDNLDEVWNGLLLAVKTATFIGMDLELSGLGNRRRLNARDLDDRYSVMAEVAKTRSVLSLGLSCFRLHNVDKMEVKAGDSGPGSPTRQKNNWKFVVQTYNILVLCSEDFIVEPVTLKFLVDHGFNFNNQYAKGISYYRGNDQPTDTESKSLRELMKQLVMSRVPVVYHNALVDLVFLYHSFYATLPATVANFTSDLTEVFSGGVFDTKYITEYVERFPASYLEYAFRRCQRSNSFCVAHRKNVVSLEFYKYPASYTYIQYCCCDLPDNMVERGDQTDRDRLQKILCHQYASYGWCPQGSSCYKSHDIDDILDLDSLKPLIKSQKRKRRRHKHKKTESDQSEDNVQDEESINQESDDMDSEEEVEKRARVASPESNLQNSNGVASLSEQKEKCKDSNNKTSSNVNELGIARKEGHRAGYDAFMTGYILATFVSQHGKLPSESTRNLKLSDLGLDEVRNKIYLCGKDIPLVVTRSNFSKTSKDHREKWAKLNVT